jgi:hypothetical protein
VEKESPITSARYAVEGRNDLRPLVFYDKSCGLSAIMAEKEVDTLYLVMDVRANTMEDV